MAENPLSFLFNGQDPNINAELRRRIALSMLSQKKAYPKTFGEGLSAIGDALGDRAVLSRLSEQEKSAVEGGNARADALLGTGTATISAPQVAKTSYTPADTTETETPPAPAPATASPGLLQTTEQPNDMLNPALTRGLAGPAVSNPPTPAQAGALLNPQPLANQNPRGAIARTIAAQRNPPAEGGYNLLDAQAGMPRIGTARGQAAGERAYPDNPDMQAYASQLNAAEQPKPGDTSSTGARGAFQFVPGTARQYGLSNPDDDMASADALKTLTADNAAAFQRINGRPPTMADLAVMHQQGGTTGSKMIAGTGNAPAANLAVNNVNPAAGPAAAVNRIKGYYGMPERPVEPRDQVAAALTPKPAVMAFDGQQTPATTPPAALLPQPQPQIRQAPPQQQIQQAPPGPYQMQKPGPVAAPVPAQMGETEAKLRDAIVRNPNDEQLHRRLRPVIDTLEANRAAENARRIEEYKAALQHKNTMDTKYEDWRVGEEKRAQEREKAPYDLRKTKAETAEIETRVEAGKVPTTRKLNDSDVQWDPATKKWIQPPGEAVGVGSPETTEAQSKEIGAYERGRRALYNLGKGDALHNWVDYGASYLHSGLPSKEFQLQWNAAKEFAAIALRKETGAGANASEIKDVITRYVPKPGADPAVVQQMARAREAVFEAIRDGIGGKHTKTLDRFDARFANEVKEIEAAKAKAASDGNPDTTVKNAASMLPPTIVNSKAERDALPRGRQYRLPSDPPDSPPRVKREHDDRH